jgi:hypothetical protein
VFRRAEAMPASSRPTPETAPTVMGRKLIPRPIAVRNIAGIR